MLRTYFQEEFGKFNNWKSETAIETYLSRTEVEDYAGYVDFEKLYKNSFNLGRVTIPSTTSSSSKYLRIVLAPSRNNVPRGITTMLQIRHMELKIME